MADEKRKPGKDRQQETGDLSKGQYGGLKGLGPGGGRDIKDATNTDDIDRDDVEFTKK